jgi:hypothetical protein
MIQGRFRQDYAGEFVILETQWVGNKREEKREWIPNPIENQHISGRAACIGSAIDQQLFNFKVLQKHRGGLLSSKKLQTYGTTEIAKIMKLDFTVAQLEDDLTWLIESGYSTTNIVYSTPKKCIQHPGEFYLIPHNVKLCSEVILPYLAAFDGHKEVFLLGFHSDTPVQSLNWQQQLLSVFMAYPGIKFYVVGEKTMMPDIWLNRPNVTPFSVREFIGYCDV